jgi:hypothetical protein
LQVALAGPQIDVELVVVHAGGDADRHDTKSTLVAVAEAPRKPTTSTNEVAEVLSASWIFRTEGLPAWVEAACVVAAMSIVAQS